MQMIRVLHAELLKLKRTLAFRVIFVLPILVALLQLFIVLKMKEFFKRFQIWAVFMTPLLITLETALLNGIEHGDKQWKHIFALPVPRSYVYFAKIIVAQALILISTFMLAILSVLVGVL